MRGSWWQTAHRTCVSSAAQVHSKGLHGAAAEVHSLPCMLVPVPHGMATSLTMVMLGMITAVKPSGRTPVTGKPQFMP